MFTHDDFCVSSLSPQLAARRLSLLGSISSRLLPPPDDHWPQRPPVPYVRSLTIIWIRLVVVTPSRLVETVVSGIVKARCSPLCESLPLKSPRQLLRFKLA